MRIGFAGGYALEELMYYEGMSCRWTCPTGERVV